MVYSVTAAKVTEAEEAIRDGASEIDMVVNIRECKKRLFFDKVEEEIRAVKRHAGPIY